jgi:hypothetical protein
VKKENIIKLPISYLQMIKNRRGPYAVSCIVTDRWLRFSETSTKLDCGEACFIDVMTTNADNMDKKICQLIITKDELLDVLSRIK